MTELEELVHTWGLIDQYQSTHRLEFFEPYDKQLQFFTHGATMRERLLMAGNQLGKTEAGAFETACHLTGQYPAWWTGRKFSNAVHAWAAGVSGSAVRDTLQKKLCGDPGIVAAEGTGFLPKDHIVDKTLGRGTPDLFDTLHVKHVSGGTSVIKFKSYEQGREKFQADTLDFVWLDEECGDQIYGECLARIAATGGMLFTTFTPLKGRTDIVCRFLDGGSKDRAYVIMTILDAKHISEAERAKIIEGYEPHERQARVNGVPMQGEGRIFTITEETLLEPIIDRMPVHWGKLWGVDFGITHFFAAVLLAWDRDNDILHIIHTIRIKDGTPLNHAAAMKRVAANVPVAWPHDGSQREKGSGEPLSTLYRKEGLLMLPDHATYPDGSMGTEAAVAEMRQRMMNAQLKVAQHLSDWLEEYRMYHRKDGLIVKVRDDLLSATQKAIMMKRFARAVNLGSKVVRNRPTVAEGVDFELH